MPFVHACSHFVYLDKGDTTKNAASDETAVAIPADKNFGHRIETEHQIDEPATNGG